MKLKSINDNNKFGSCCQNTQNINAIAVQRLTLRGNSPKISLKRAVSPRFQAAPSGFSNRQVLTNKSPQSIRTKTSDYLHIIDRLPYEIKQYRCLSPKKDTKNQIYFPLKPNTIFQSQRDDYMLLTFKAKKQPQLQIKKPKQMIKQTKQIQQNKKDQKTDLSQKLIKSRSELYMPRTKFDTSLFNTKQSLVSRQQIFSSEMIKVEQSVIELDYFNPKESLMKNINHYISNMNNI